MLIHLVRVALLVAGTVFCTVLPFLPGRYEVLARPLSVMAQTFGTAGLLLVPIGVIWMVAGRSPRSAGKQYGFGLTALVAASFVWALVSLGALVSGGFLFGLGMLAFGAYAISRTFRRLPALRDAPSDRASAAPLYLIAVPAAVFSLQMVIEGPAGEFSLGRAVRNSAPLIADIEKYHAEHGHYPASLVSLHQDYLPMVVGIETYLYEPSGDAYNLLFEQPSFQFGTREIVVYNPREEQTAMSHNSDLLRLSPRALAGRGGYYAAHDTPHAHWKSFLFD
jgi:hypothetical protein